MKHLQHGTTSHSDYRYRVATNADCEVVRKIIFDALASYGLLMDPSTTDKDLYDIEKHYPEGLFWVITDNNSPIHGSFALYCGNKTGIEIRKMYFSPELRGKGLGKWAMDFLLKTAKNLGYEEINLETASVLKEAILLYRKFGFEESIGDLHSHRCDVFMKKVL